MVRSSNEVSREICWTIRRGWEGGNRSPGSLLMKDPGPKADVAAFREQTQTTNPPTQMKRANRSQSPHSSDEAEQHKSAEPRGIGR
jgi:hypothetical protein